MHLHKFLFFFISYPSSTKKKFEFITLCLIYLSLAQILRIASFTICLKYFPDLWNIFHNSSSYIFYYPGMLALWYLYSSSLNASVRSLIIVINKYFLRILLFFIFYLSFVKPLQINVTKYFVKPLIEKKIIDKKHYELDAYENNIKIIHKSDKINVLQFKPPFGGSYFLLLFFLWFRPKSIAIFISVYNLILIPIYALAIEFFLNGYVIFGDLILLHKKFYVLIYNTIFMIGIIHSLVFTSSKKKPLHKYMPLVLFKPINKIFKF